LVSFYLTSRGFHAWFFPPNCTKSSLELAQALIMAGQVYVGERLVDKPGTFVPLDAECRLAQAPAELKYASRGGLKLEKAHDTFELDPSGRVALDVGYGQLAWTLRNDPRVVVMEHTNIRHLTSLPEPVECVTIDVSFISLRLVLPAIVPLLAPQAWVVALVKPQFEAGKADADREQV
jgi:23S rRNA (cytidine1920-2'-O)/16S rRNA (cytidine1409-2'-O)-methyltransferase